MQSVRSIGVQCNLLAAPSLQKLSKAEEIDQHIICGTPLSVGGDGRADTPGHSAKYGLYGLDTNKVIHIQLVQVAN